MFINFSVEFNERRKPQNSTIKSFATKKDPFKLNYRVVDRVRVLNVMRPGGLNANLYRIPVQNNILTLNK